jgi:hypothetical protein
VAIEPLSERMAWDGVLNQSLGASTHANGQSTNRRAPC